MMRWASLFRAVASAPDWREALTLLVEYLAVARDRLEKHDIRRVLHKLIGPSSDEVLMTLAEQWIAEGMQKGEARGEARRGARRGAGRGEARGEAKAKAQDVLTFLRARGLRVPDAVRDRVLACTDLDTLDRWITLAARCSSAEELLADTP
jgi:hypothetical protein